MPQETAFNHGTTFSEGSAQKCAEEERGRNRRSVSKKRSQSKDRCHTCGQFRHHAWEKSARITRRGSRVQRTQWPQFKKLMRNRPRMERTTHTVTRSALPMSAGLIATKLGVSFNKEEELPRWRPARLMSGEHT